MAPCPRWGRALLRLALADAAGQLIVRGPAPARIALEGGRLLHVESAGLSLGGHVARVAPRALAPALRGARRRPGRAGDALRASGVPEGLLAEALRAQHRSRLGALLLAPPSALAFEERPPTGGAEAGTLDLVDAVLGAARSAPVPQGAALATLELTTLGRRALPGRALTARESALRDWLAAGRCPSEDVWRELGAPVGPLVARWRALGLVTAPRRGSAALLLRTRLALSRGEPVVDAPRRRRLRRLAGELHPDRFDGPLAPASTAVTRQLLAAAARAG